MVRHSRILYLLLCLIVLVAVMVFGLVRHPTPVPTSPSAPAIPSGFTLAKSDIGSVYAQETHYVKPSPDGRYLYIYNMDSRNIIVLNLENRTIVQNINMPGFWAQASEMIFSSDGQRMYTLSVGQVGACDIVVIDTKTQKIDHLIPLPKEYGTVFAESGPCITISPDEQFLYISGVSGIYRVNIESEQVAKISDIGRIVSLAFTSKGDHILGTNVATNSLDVIDPSSGRLIDSTPVGDSPQYAIISPDGQRVYVSNWGSGDVSVVDFVTKQVISTIPVGVNPLGMCVTLDGHKLYVAITGQDLSHTVGNRLSREKVVVIDTTTLSVSKQLLTGYGPRFVNISADGSRLYVNEEIGRIHIIDTANDKIVESIVLARPAYYQLFDIAVTPDESKIFVCTQKTLEVLVIDRATHDLLADFNVTSVAIAISSDGRYAYVPGRTFAVINIPKLTAKYVAMPAIKGVHLKIALSPDNSIAYVADPDANLLHVIDLQHWRLVTSISVGTMGISEFGLAITPDGEKVFVCNGFSKTISVISTANNEVVDTIAMESAPWGIDISSDGKLAYVIEIQSDVRGFTHAVVIDVATDKIIQRWAHEPIGFGNPWDVVVSPDGQHAYFGGVDGDCVIILDINSGATRYVGVGLNPCNLALSEDGRLLFVSNKDSDNIMVIDTKTEAVTDIVSLPAK